jgi:beta-lactamase regulating signal transducer with metallopeptidase domain
MPYPGFLLDIPLNQLIGWILAHSLWQGGVIALVLMVCLRSCSGSRPQVRYALACIALLLVVLVPVATVLGQYYWNVAAEAVTLEIASDNSTWGSAPVGLKNLQDISSSSPLSWIGRIRIGFESLLPFAVLFWWGGVLIMSIWHLGGWYRLKRLEDKSLGLINKSWQTKVSALAARLNIKYPVRILISSSLVSPAVTGWIKPTILFPLTVLSGLPADQIEAIFLHELAHIRRYDFLVNLIQIFVETIGFYHPAVWWINKRIRIEREHCCDDIAAEFLNDKACYATSLLNLEDLRMQTSQPAIGAAGNVRIRIYRLLGIHNQAENRSNLPIALFAMFLMVSWLVYPLWANTENPSETGTGRWEQLFDGQTLDGWQQHGLGKGSFRIQDGQIIGSSVKGAFNTASYLCTQAFYDDFELEYEVKLDPKMDAGLMFRSQVYDTRTEIRNEWKGKPNIRVFEPEQVYGYQVEINGEGNHTSGSIWDEQRRMIWLSNTSKDPVASRALKENDWNTCRIVCKGDHIQTWINGIVCTDIHDNVAGTGFIGLQANNKYSSEPLFVYWRNMRIRSLGN